MVARNMLGNMGYVESPFMGCEKNRLYVIYTQFEISVAEVIRDTECVQYIVIRRNIVIISGRISNSVAYF